MNIKRRFTKWYVKKGYKFGYDFHNCEMIGGDDVFPPMPVTQPKAVWLCPWWVKPLLIFFSPSVYTMETLRRQFYDGFMEGVKKGMEARENMPEEFRKLFKEDLYENNN